MVAGIPISRMHMDKPLAYTVSEFLRCAGIGRTHFYRLINSGELKARKQGKRTIILAADADAWLNALPSYGSKAA